MGSMRGAKKISGRVGIKRVRHGIGRIASMGYRASSAKIYGGAAMGGMPAIKL